MFPYECFRTKIHCRISYGGGLDMSPCIMGLTTQDPYIQLEHTKLYKILKFRVNLANIEQVFPPLIHSLSQHLKTLLSEFGNFQLMTVPRYVS